MAKQPTRARKRVRKQVADGVAHIHASFNNTIVRSAERF
ncbi:30S ribosomal protein S11, partial [Vibrio metoecus]